MELRIFIIWYLAFFCIGVIGLPISSRIFSKWGDKGYGFAKIIGLMLVSLPLWFLASSGDLLSKLIDKINGGGAEPNINLFPFNEVTVWLFFLVFLGGACYMLYKSNFKITKTMVLVELTFLVNMIIWTYIRSTNPRAEGTEKFMNLAFMSSISKSEYFPPADPWMSGYSINYYYLGHYMFTYVSKLTGIAVVYAYNYGLVSISALSFTALVSLFARLFDSNEDFAEYSFVKYSKNFFARMVRAFFDLQGKVLSKKNVTSTSEYLSFNSMRFGLAYLGASLICYGGTIYVLVSRLMFSLGLQTDVSANKEAFYNFFWPRYFFPDPTRSIPYTITEYPAYSIVLGDLHGHFLELPFFIFIAALFVTLLSKRKTWRQLIAFNLISSFVVFSLYGINTWGFITANFLFFVANSWQVVQTEKTALERIVSKIVLLQIALILPGLIFMLPYLLNYKAAVTGDGNFLSKTIGIAPAYMLLHRENIFIKKIYQNKLKEIPLWLMFWGGYIWLSLGYVMHIFWGKITAKDKRNLRIGLFFLACALALIIGVEVIFVRDLFSAVNPPHFRTNTVFKFYYHAWTLWGIASIIGLYLVFAYGKAKYLLGYITYTALTAIVCFGVFSYTTMAIESFYPHAFNKGAEKFPATTPKTMNGMDYIARDQVLSSDYVAINWINENIEGQHVFAEAVGTGSETAYSYFSRIATHTGHSAVVGWTSHQWQWRGSSVEADERRTNVEKIYNSRNLAEVQSVVEKYKIEYIYYGVKERDPKYYISTSDETISQLADVVYSDEKGNKIFKVR